MKPQPLDLPFPGGRDGPLGRTHGKKRVSKARAIPEETGSPCPFLADGDRSPAGKQKRADELRATVPTEVAAQVQGWVVSELAHSFCQWEGAKAR